MCKRSYRPEVCLHGFSTFARNKAYSITFDQMFRSVKCESMANWCWNRSATYGMRQTIGVQSIYAKSMRLALRSKGPSVNIAYKNAIMWVFCCCCCEWFDSNSKKFSFSFHFVQEYELVLRKNQCCGECVATKCSYNNKLYEIGRTWKSDDNCTYLECTQVPQGNPDDRIMTAEISRYRKACPPLPECPSDRIQIQDCCQVCSETVNQLYSANARTNFIHPLQKYSVAYARATYRNHPCNRHCRQGKPALTCFYKFIVSVCMCACAL